MTVAGSLYAAINGPSWDDLRFPAQGINPPGLVSDPDIDTVTYPGTLLFASNATEMIAGVAQMPHSWAEGSGIRPHIHWAKTTSASGGVVWQLAFVVVANGAVIGSYSSWVSGTNGVPHNDTAHTVAIDSFAEISMTGKIGSCLVLWKIQRDHDAVGDTYAADARFLEFDFHYRAYGLGSEKEYPS